MLLDHCGPGPLYPWHTMPPCLRTTLRCFLPHCTASAQVMTQRIEFAQTHNQYLMRLEQEREQRKKNEIDRLNRHYDDINTENFLRYQDKMQQQVRLQQALVDRHRHEEEEAVLRENLRKQLEKENVKKTTLLELKHAHATAVCSARQEELRQKVRPMAWGMQCPVLCWGSLSLWTLFGGPFPSNASLVWLDT